MLIAPSEHEGPVTSSYIDSVYEALSILFSDCVSKAALIFTLLLIKIITTTVMETTTLMIKAVAMELIDIMYTELCVALPESQDVCV